MKTLEATQLAENFPKFLDRVLSGHESFEIVKEGVPCAYLVPAGIGACDSHQFAEEIAGEELSFEDRRSLASDIRRSRDALNPLKNPWG
jgi:antitoxin (DNA-binding transcriptional repressor) of toxin-antitoxin stability system